ncbi:MAG: lipoprotein-releasing ABC transporter permease subunit [Ignavibacterium sp.]
MKVEYFIGRRYLLSKHKINFITIISYLSICGITIGVAALIVVLAVFNGFSSLVSSYLMNFDPHLRIEVKTNKSFSYLHQIDSLLQNEKEIVSYSPFVNGKVLVMRDKITQVVSLKGIDIEKGENVYGLKKSIGLGAYDFENDGLPKAVVGIILADKLQSIVGDTITIIPPTGIEGAITSLSIPKYQRFIISGIFISDNNDYDANYIFTSIDIGKILLGYKNNFQGYEMRLSNINKSNSVKEKLSQKIDKHLFEVNTWYDFHKELYSVMQIERWVAYILLSLIILVAVFNIFSSLTMGVMEKKRDIGVLSALGLNKKSIQKIFIYQGLYVGIIGTALGFILSFIVYYLQIHYKLYPLDPTQYKIDALPMELRFTDFIVVGIASILLSFLSSIYPSKKSAEINPVEAIKWE